MRRRVHSTRPRSTLVLQLYLAEAGCRTSVARSGNPLEIAGQTTLVRHPFGLDTTVVLVRFSLACSGISAVPEVVPALRGAEGIDRLPQESPQAIDRPLAGLAQQGLELGEGQLDRVEVRAVRRQQP